MTSVRTATAVRTAVFNSSGKVVLYVLVFATAGFFALPLVVMVLTSFKEQTQVFAIPLEWLPRPFVASHFADHFTNPAFWLYLRNSVILTGLSIIGAVASNPIIAFSFARLRWPGRDVLFIVLLATIILPYQVTMIPLYVIFSQLGWINTYLPLVIDSFLGHPVFIFMLRQFIRSIPSEMYDAGRIDGCNNFQLYWSLTLPLLVAPIAAIAVFRFMWTWNDFLGPLIYLSRTEMKTLPLGLMDLLEQQTASGGLLDWPSTMALTFITLVPCIVVFFLAQRVFLQRVNFRFISQ